MTLREMINEVKRILAYDGQLADAGDDVDNVIRNKITEATFWWVRTVRFPLSIVSTSVAGGQRQVDMENSDNVIMVYRAWWQANSGEKSTLELIKDYTEYTSMDFFAMSESPTHCLLMGGKLLLHPVPANPGTLIVWGVQGKRFASNDDNNEVTIVPISGQMAVCLRAAAYYLMPYTELAPKAAQYLSLSAQMASEWRSDAFQTGLTDWTSNSKRWEAFP